MIDPSTRELGRRIVDEAIMLQKENAELREKLRVANAKIDDSRLVLLMEGLSRSIQRLRICGEEEFPPILATSELDLMERRLAQLRSILTVTQGQR